MAGIQDEPHYAEYERQCLMQADRARDPNARDAHLKLAELYARRARSVDETNSYKPVLR